MDVGSDSDASVDALSDDDGPGRAEARGREPRHAEAAAELDDAPAGDSNRRVGRQNRPVDEAGGRAASPRGVDVAAAPRRSDDRIFV